jgi:hypothetical protein
MEKVYNYENAIIYVRSVDTYDRENLKRATIDFLKKVMNGGNQIEYRNPPRNFREK